MDWAILPPEVVSAQLYAGPGAGSLHAATAAWEQLAAELSAAANSYQAVLSSLTSHWRGPSSSNASATLQRYRSWLNATAIQATQTAAATNSAATAYHTAVTAAVPPAVVTANRATLAQLIASNLLGQNTAAIAATEAIYGQMWAQDAAAMHTYAAAAQAATSTLAAPSTAGIDLSPDGWIGQLTLSTLSSGPYQLPTSVLALVSGLWAASSVAAVPDILNHVRNTIQTPPTPASTPIPPSVRVTARAASGGRIGALSVPPTWATQTPDTVRVTAPAAAASAAAEAPEPIPLPLANLNSLARNDIAKRQPRYGDPPTVMPKTPAGG